MITASRLRNYSVYVSVFVAAVFILFLISVPTAHADMGPKPSVRISIAGLNGRTCYGTLLSAQAEYGPHTAYDPSDENTLASYADPESPNYDEGEHALWRAFNGYADNDGFFYLQSHGDCSGGAYEWSYFPPDEFKLLLYFPQTNTFAVSGKLDRYAFDSYYAVDISGAELSSERAFTLSVRRSYDYTTEIVGVIVRIILTVLVELLVAKAFKLTQKRQILTVLVVNVVTQTALNVALNVINVRWGAFAMFFLYFMFELAVFVIEGAAYYLIFNYAHKRSPAATEAKEETATAARPAGLPQTVPSSTCILFSFTANLISFILGVILSLVVPAIF